MTRPDLFYTAIRAAVAVQVAILEVHDEPQSDNIAIPAMETCLAELARAVKAIKKEYS